MCVKCIVVLKACYGSFLLGGACDTCNMMHLSWQIKFPFLSRTNCDHGNSNFHTIEESCMSDGKTMSQKGSCLTDQE